MADRAKTVIRPAAPADVPLILSLIQELAEYERLAHTVQTREQDLHKHLFGDRPVAEAVIAEWDGAGVAFALFFHNFSTFVGKPGIYLEDLYVRPAFRGRGIGKALLLHVVSLARHRDCGRVEWAVLDWNEPAIRFYESLGAKPMDQWRLFRLSQEALDRIVAQV